MKTARVGRSHALMLLPNGEGATLVARIVPEEQPKRLRQDGQYSTDHPPDGYAEYLRSDAWQAIERRVVRRDLYCITCGNLPRVVHHRSYAPSVIAGNDDSQLLSLCNDCHKAIHTRPDGTKREDLDEIDGVLRSMVEARYRKR